MKNFIFCAVWQAGPQENVSFLAIFDNFKNCQDSPGSLRLVRLQYLSTLPHSHMTWSAPYQWWSTTCPFAVKILLLWALQTIQQRQELFLNNSANFHEVLKKKPPVDCPLRYKKTNTCCIKRIQCNISNINICTITFSSTYSITFFCPTRPIMFHFVYCVNTCQSTQNNQNMVESDCNFSKAEDVEIITEFFTEIAPYMQEYKKMLIKHGNKSHDNLVDFF